MRFVSGRALRTTLQMTRKFVQLWMLTASAAYFAVPVPVLMAQCTDEQKLTAMDAAAEDNFGLCVSVSGDTTIVGAYGNDDAGPLSGSAYVFVRSGGVWKQQQMLMALDASAEDLFGACVSVDGDTAVVGAYDSPGTGPGSAYVFVRFGGGWTQQQKLTASDAATTDSFGGGVLVVGDTALIAAQNDDHSGVVDAGSVYVFVRSAGVWTEQQKLTASDAATADLFGTASMDGDRAIIGAYFADHAGGVDAGAAYVFRRSGDFWTEVQKLTASDAGAHDHFGNAVSVEGDTAVIGSYFDDHMGGVDAGSAYVFRYSGGVWCEVQRLAASDAAPGARFGTSVALSGDALVVGAYEDDGSGQDSGAAYLFVRTGGVWTEQQKLTATDSAAGARFGISTAMSGDTVVVGAYLDDDAGFGTGSAYVFRCMTPASIPTLSQWGAGIMAMLFASAGTVVFRQRRVIHGSEFGSKLTTAQEIRPE